MAAQDGNPSLPSGSGPSLPGGMLRQPARSGSLLQGAVAGAANLVRGAAAAIARVARPRAAPPDGARSPRAAPPAGARSEPVIVIDDADAEPRGPVRARVRAPGDGAGLGLGADGASTGPASSSVAMEEDARPDEQREARPVVPRDACIGDEVLRLFGGSARAGKSVQPPPWNPDEPSLLGAPAALRVALIHCVMLKMPSEVWAYQMITLMAGSAREFFSSYVDQDGPLPAWSTIEHDFLKVFKDRMTTRVHDAREQLVSGSLNMSGRDDTVQKYIVRYDTCARVCTDMNEADKILWFHRGLSPALRTLCAVNEHKMRFTSLLALQKFALGEQIRMREAGKTTNGSAALVGAAFGAQASSKWVAKPKASAAPSAQTGSGKAGTSAGDSDKPDSKGCWHCGSMDHQRLECPTLPAATRARLVATWKAKQPASGQPASQPPAKKQKHFSKKK
jgi:hypothetical protein